MFVEVYNFFFEYLFNSEIPSFLSAQGTEFTCIVFSIITICALIAVALIPICAIARFVISLIGFRG